RLAASEIVFLHADWDRLVEMAPHRFQIEKAKAVIVRAATDEAMTAGQIAERAADLEPEIVEMRKRHGRDGMIEDGQRYAHQRVALYRSRSDFSVMSVNTSRTCSKPVLNRKSEFRP